jgi:hypothetical protein
MRVNFGDQPSPLPRSSRKPGGRRTSAQKNRQGPPRDRSLRQAFRCRGICLFDQLVAVTNAAKRRLIRALEIPEELLVDNQRVSSSEFLPGPIEAAEAAAFIEEMTGDLAKLATAANLSMLAHLPNLARVEASVPPAHSEPEPRQDFARRRSFEKRGAFRSGGLQFENLREVGADDGRPRYPNVEFGMTREEGERLGKARGVVIRIDGDAANGRRQRNDAKAIGAESPRRAPRASLAALNRHGRPGRTLTLDRKAAAGRGRKRTARMPPCASSRNVRWRRRFSLIEQRARCGSPRRWGVPATLERLGAAIPSQICVIRSGLTASKFLPAGALVPPILAGDRVGALWRLPHS